MTGRLLRLAFFICLLGTKAWPVVAAEPARSVEASYARDIKPLLSARCYACHGALKQEAGLRLDTGASIRRGGDNGVVFTPGHSGGSLVERITSTDASVRMPPLGEPLSAQQVQLIQQWINSGAVSPDNEQPQRDPRQHWAFRQPVRPAVPGAAETGKNPIDAFVDVEHRRLELVPQAAASKPVLLRRVYLDLTGLPPSREELQEFLADESPDALEKVVDRLLDSPAYGERWGRHWMDVWRYSDWFGRRYVPDVWNSAPQIWRWRDWIVDSLNRDKGYGQMVAEMLAADEIAPEDDQAGYATGYLIRNWYALNPNDWMRSNVEHTGKAFLGLTFNCAHCHDHKYDPITQDDYFRFRAFFEPISIRQDRVPGEADPGPFEEYQYGVLRKIVRLGSVRIFDKTPDAPTWFYTAGDERNRVVERGSIPAGLPAFLTPASFSISKVTLPPRAAYPGLRPSIHETIRKEHEQALALAESQIPVRRAAADAALPELRKRLTEVEKEWSEARSASLQSGHALALAGIQSLILNATTGRRLINHGLRSIHAIDGGLSIRFQLQILKDAHLSFQLLKDAAKGMTAALVAFDKGRILSYQTGTTEFQVGQYDFATGQNRFEVTLKLDGNPDQCRLSIRSLKDNQILVSNVAIARNGWNPIGNASQTIAFDARTGAVAVLDDIVVSAVRPAETEAGPAEFELARIDFEPPDYQDCRDVVGVDGWFGSTHSLAGATSLVSAAIDDDGLKPAAQTLSDARRAVEVFEWGLKSAEKRRLASLAELDSLSARIAADQAKHGEADGTNLSSLCRIAGQKARDAALLAAAADIATGQKLFAEAELMPTKDPNRAKDIDAALKQLNVAATALDRAQASLANSTEAEAYPPFSPAYPASSTGRRKALAEWIASRDNPLTARVAINHLWLRHFHSPLVASVFDFGVNGAPPTNPELLDWLAVELMEANWSMKSIHRLIVTSHAYARSSNLGDEHLRARSIDPQNKSLWRMNVGRMEAEVVRDSLLAVAGRLDSRMGGQELENKDALTTHRRTIYYCCEPEIDGKSAFGNLFDAPEPAECYRRSKSIIPQQALALTNSDLIHELSEALATTIWRSLSPRQQVDPDAFAITACEQILSRAPTDAELNLCRIFLTNPAPEQDDPARSREALIRVLLNHNDFVAIR